MEPTGKKFDQDKPPMELLSHLALVEVAKVLALGATKYGKFNYRGGLTYGRLIGAAYRHLGAFNSGENEDPETGLSHIAHVATCAIMLLDMLREHPTLDNRYVPNPGTVYRPSQVPAQQDAGGDNQGE